MSSTLLEHARAAYGAERFNQLLSLYPAAAAVAAEVAWHPSWSRARQMESLISWLAPLGWSRQVLIRAWSRAKDHGFIRLSYAAAASEYWHVAPLPNDTADGLGATAKDVAHLMELQQCDE